MAADQDISEGIDRLIGARSVKEVAEIAEHYHRALDELDLNEPRTILEIETIYSEFRAKSAEEAARKRKQSAPMSRRL